MRHWAVVVVTANPTIIDVFTDTIQEPPMNAVTTMRLAIAVSLAALVSHTVHADHCGTEHEAEHNTLSEQEVADGWVLLFDGETMDHWRGFKMKGAPEGWVVQDQAITRTGQDSWIDLITREQYDDFELSLEWKISEGGNSGIFFNVTEKHEHVWDSGPEMQVLDNGTHHDGNNTLTSAGANYALHVPSEDATRPVGEFNHALIIVRGNHVEHHLNGVKLLEYELASDEWEALVAASKFNEMPGYGRAESGHIALQDHGDIVSYRNIKIRVPQAAQSQPTTQGDQASE